MPRYFRLEVFVLPAVQSVLGGTATRFSTCHRACFIHWQFYSGAMKSHPSIHITEAVLWHAAGRSYCFPRLESRTYQAGSGTAGGAGGEERQDRPNWSLRGLVPDVSVREHTGGQRPKPCSHVSPASPHPMPYRDAQGNGLVGTRSPQPPTGMSLRTPCVPVGGRTRCEIPGLTHVPHRHDDCWHGFSN